jgi:two-component system CheB/CheR fusion protein
LNDDGCLLLSPSESIGGQTDLFEAISKKWSLFRRLRSVGHQPMEIPIVTNSELRSKIGLEAQSVPEVAYQELIQRLILQDYAPATVLVNRKCEILSLLGPLVDYLEFPAGDFTTAL